MKKSILFGLVIAAVFAFVLGAFGAVNSNPGGKTDVGIEALDPE